MRRGLNLATTAAGGGRGVDHRPRRQAQPGRRRRTDGHGTASGTADVDAAADGQPAVAGVQDHLAVGDGDAVGLDDAGCVDDIVDDAAGGAGGHLHQAAIGRQRAAVGQRRLVCRAGQREGQQFVAIEIHSEGLGAAQHHTAQIGRDGAAVVHRLTGQNRIAAVGCLDVAPVGDGGGGVGRGPVELIIAGHEVLVGDIGSGGQQTSDVDLGTRAEQHAIGIDDPHLAIGGHRTQQCGGIASHNSVEGNRIGIGLLEVQRLVATQGKGLPVDDRLGRVLLNYGVERRGGYAGLTGDQLCSRWSRASRSRHQGRQAGGHA